MNGERELLGAAILAGAVLLVLCIAEAWARIRRPDPELPRKFVHTAGGAVCLFFPFLIESPWTVLAMSSSLAAFFALGARFGFLKSLHGVARRSRGTEYFPLAIFVVFVLAKDHPWLYLSSVLTLIVSDALAAIVGSRYGRIRYLVEDEEKSLEGSAVFLLFSFLCVQLPAHFLSDLPGGTIVLSALLVSVLVTGFEAISLRGSDNLFVPLGACIILAKVTGKPFSEIVYQSLALLGILSCVAVAVWRTRSFNVGGAIAFALFAYGAWSLGSEWWGLPVLLGFGVYMVEWFLFPMPSEGISFVRVRVVTRALLPSFLVLVAANVTEEYQFLFGPYLASVSVLLALSLWGRQRRIRGGQISTSPLILAVMAAISWTIAVAFPWLLQRCASSWEALAACAVVTMLAMLGCRAFLEKSEPADAQHWSLARMALVAIASFAVAGGQAMGWIPLWLGGGG